MELKDLNEFDRLRLDHSIFDSVEQGEISDRYDHDNVEIDDNKEYVAPVMPEDFYQKVEGFLMQPAPKVVNLMDKPKKQTSVGVKYMKPKVKNFTALKVRTNDTGDHRAKGGNSEEFNLDLLQQAFAYSEKLAREAVEEEELATRVGDNSNNNNNNITAFKTTNALIETSVMRSKQRSGKPKATASDKSISIVKRLRDQTKQYGNPKSNKSGEDSTLSNSFSVQSIPEEDTRRNVLDFDSLITNFQTGANISKLKQELMQSQQSKSNSEQLMRQIAAEFNLGGGRR